MRTALCVLVVAAFLSVPGLAYAVAPVNTVPGSQTTGTDQPLVFSAASGNQLSFSDSDGPGPYEVEVNSTNGTAVPSTTAGLTVTGSGTNAVRLIGTLANVNTALDGVVWTPTPGYDGPASIQLETDDQNGAGGFTDTDTVAITVTNVAPVNQVPPGQTLLRDRSLVFSAAAGRPLSFTDADGPGPYEVEVNSTNGTAVPVAIGGVTVSGSGTTAVRLIGTLADVNAALDGLVWTPNPGFTGAASLSLETDDRNGTGGRNDTDGVPIQLVAPRAPIVTTGDASAVTEGTATVAGTVDAGGLPTGFRIEYGTTVAYGSTTAVVAAGDGFAAVPVSQQLTGLAGGTTYHYRVVATNAEGESTGADRTFTTTASTPPAVPTPTPAPGATPAPGTTVAPGATPAPTPDTSPPRLAVLPVASRVGRRTSITVRVRCDAGEPRACAGALRLRSVGRVRVGSVRRTLTTASVRFTAAPGRTVAVSVRLSRTLRAALRRNGRITFTATATARDAAGNTGTARARVQLRR